MFPADTGVRTRDGQTDRQTDTRRVRPAEGREVLIPCPDAGCMVLPERCHGACQREDISRSVSGVLGAGIKIATLFLALRAAVRRVVRAAHPGPLSWERNSGKRDLERERERERERCC